MASCNDDFPLIEDDSSHHALTHHQHQQQQVFPSVSAEKVSAAGDSDADADSGSAAFYSYAETAEDSDPAKPGAATPNGKRNPYYYKKLKPSSASESGGGGEYRVDYRKDREEWSDSAIACLLDAYTEKFTPLNRGNLRGRDWEEVAEIVSERCDNQKSCKSVEQCKNKIDNLKKRYKVELQRMNSGGFPVSQWHWFKKIEAIVGNSPSLKACSDEDRSGGASSYMLRQSKRYKASSLIQFLVFSLFFLSKLGAESCLFILFFKIEIMI